MKTGVRGHSRPFLYQIGYPTFPLRTETGLRQDAERAVFRIQQGVARYVVNGVKGPSWLSVLDHFDLVRGIAVDYMLGILLCAQKLFLTLWFSSKFSKFHFSISSKIKDVRARLSKISPTMKIKRLPRSIEDTLKYWKASELPSFLLYYGLPTLYGLIPDNYFNHYTLAARKNCSLVVQIVTRSEAVGTSLSQSSSGSSSRDTLTMFNLHICLIFRGSVRAIGLAFLHHDYVFSVIFLSTSRDLQIFNTSSKSRLLQNIADTLATAHYISSLPL